MTALFSDEQAMIAETARRFALDALAPHSARWDAEGEFPVETLRAAAGLGFAGIYLGEAHGGAGLGRLDAVLIFEQLAYGDVSTAAFLSTIWQAGWLNASAMTINAARGCPA